MKFSTRSTYGLRAMINLAKNKGRQSVSLAQIAKMENISLGYLERIFSSLKKEGIVESEKGVSGGYRLAKKPSETTIFDIISAVEKEMNIFHCLDKQGKVYCNKKCDCGVTSVLAKVQSSVNSTLKNIKLSDLL